MMPDPAILQPGTLAPDFELPATGDRNLTLREFRGRPVILIFYPADWSPVCGDQLAIYAELMDEFHRYDAQLLAVSVDNVWSHVAYAEARNLPFPLLSDFEPKGAVSRRYGAYRDDEGNSARALFVLDRDGVIRWSLLSRTWDNPGADGILAALDNLTTEPAGAR